jgi:hypothetical protein
MIQQRTHAIQWWGVGLLVAACSDTGTVGRHAVDGGGRQQDDLDGAADGDGDAERDAAISDADGSAAATLVVTLEATPESTDAEAACDMACFQVSAQVSGGREPYTFTWSDPALNGAGPHRLCTPPSAELNVRVTDASEGQVEFGSVQRSGEASTRLTPPEACAEPTPCFCDYVGPDLLPLSLNNSPQAGSTFTVCAGTPSIHEAWEILPDLTKVDGTHFVQLDNIDEISIPLSEPIMPGEILWVSSGAGNVFGQGTSEPCGPSITGPDDIIYECATRLQGTQPVRYLRVKVREGSLRAAILRLDLFKGCTPPKF